MKPLDTNWDELSSLMFFARTVGENLGLVRGVIVAGNHSYVVCADHWSIE